MTIISQNYSKRKSDAESAINKPAIACTTKPNAVYVYFSASSKAGYTLALSAA